VEGKKESKKYEVFGINGIGFKQKDFLGFGERDYLISLD
jgi:hypothetical protein